MTFHVAHSVDRKSWQLVDERTVGFSRERGRKEESKAKTSASQDRMGKRHKDKKHDRIKSKEEDEEKSGQGKNGLCDTQSLLRYRYVQEQYLLYPLLFYPYNSCMNDPTRRYLTTVVCSTGIYILIFDLSRISGSCVSTLSVG